MKSRAALLVLLLTLSGCGTQQLSTETAGGGDTLGVAADGLGSPVDEGSVENLPATKPDTLRLEGVPEPVQLRLFSTPDTFALPFYTYHPEDMVGQIGNADNQSTVRFTANFGGKLTEDARLELYVYPRGLTRDDAHAEVPSRAAGYQRVVAPERRYSWSLEEYSLNSKAHVGRFVLGQHGGRFFSLHLLYPPEFGDGFPARAAVILDQWHWIDNGAKLGS